jgi:hypothetical protein
VRRENGDGSATFRLDSEGPAESDTPIEQGAAAVTSRDRVRVTQIAPRSGHRPSTVVRDSLPGVAEKAPAGSGVWRVAQRDEYLVRRLQRHRDNRWRMV